MNKLTLQNFCGGSLAQQFESLYPDILSRCGSGEKACMTISIERSHQFMQNVLALVAPTIDGYTSSTINICLGDNPHRRYTKMRSSQTL